MELIKQTCRSCKAPVYWVPAMGGKRHIVNAKPLRVWVPTAFMDDNGNQIYHLQNAYESHYATCPDADQWRKKKG